VQNQAASGRADGDYCRPRTLAGRLVEMRKKIDLPVQPG